MRGRSIEFKETVNLQKINLNANLLPRVPQAANMKVVKIIRANQFCNTMRPVITQVSRV